MTEASSISYLVQKTFLEGNDAGEQEGYQDNWNMQNLRGKIELIEGPVWGFANCRPL